MKGKAVSVYIPFGAYERIESESKERGLSLSSYMVQCSDPLGPFHKSENGRLDRIEDKLATLIKSYPEFGQLSDDTKETSVAVAKKAKPNKNELSVADRIRKKMDNTKASKGDEELEAEKKTKIPDVIKTVSDIPFKPMPKKSWEKSK